MCDIFFLVNDNLNVSPFKTLKMLISRFGYFKNATVTSYQMFSLYTFLLFNITE